MTIQTVTDSCHLPVVFLRAEDFVLCCLFSLLPLLVPPDYKSVVRLTGMVI